MKNFINKIKEIYNKAIKVKNGKWVQTDRNNTSKEIFDTIFEDIADLGIEVFRTKNAELVFLIEHEEEGCLPYSLTLKALSFDNDYEGDAETYEMKQEEKRKKELERQAKVKKAQEKRKKEQEKKEKEKEE